MALLRVVFLVGLMELRSLCHAVGAKWLWAPPDTIA